MILGVWAYLGLHTSGVGAACEHVLAFSGVEIFMLLGLALFCILLFGVVLDCM